MARVSVLTRTPQEKRARAVGAVRWLSARPDADGSDADFQPQRKAPPSGASTAAEVIEADIKGHDVFLYMKGFPSAPQCGFSYQVVAILNAMGVPFSSRNVLEDDAIREGVKEFSDWPTIPQLYVKGEFVGGCDIVMSMFKNGELEELLGEAGVEYGKVKSEE